MLIFFALFAITLALPVLWPRIDLLASGIFYHAGQGFFLADNPVFVALHWLAYYGARGLGAAFVILAFVSFLLNKKKRNGIPAFAGMTALIESPTLQEHGHSREGGNPIYLCFNTKSWTFLLLALLLGPALIANAGFKDHWGRARPREVTEFGGTAAFSPALVPQAEARRNGSFVSGDGAFGFFLPAFALVAPRRKSRGVFWGSMATAGLFSLARLAMGAHFLSDIIYAAFLMLATSSALHAAMYGWRETAVRWRLWFGKDDAAKAARFPSP